MDGNIVIVTSIMLKSVLLEEHISEHEIVGQGLVLSTELIESWKLSIIYQNEARCLLGLEIN